MEGTTHINHHQHGTDPINAGKPRHLTGKGVASDTFAVDLGPVTIFATREQVAELLATVSSWDLP